ncbi:MAG: hypothetical protein Fur0042_25340 [Cyanophyceae cyanobacterium]
MGMEGGEIGPKPPKDWDWIRAIAWPRMMGLRGKLYCPMPFEMRFVAPGR